MASSSDTHNLASRDGNTSNHDVNAAAGNLDQQPSEKKVQSDGEDTGVNDITSDNINSHDEKGWTPVMKAAVEGNLAQFNFLVSKDADLTMVDEDGNSLLHLACQKGNKEIVQQVLMSSNINSRGAHDMMAAFHGHFSVFEYLMSKKADLTLTTSIGDGILHMASHGGNREILDKVFQPRRISVRGAHGYTPIMKAAFEGHLEVFEFLLSQKADVSLMDDYGNIALHLASQGGNRDIVQRLLTRSNINCKGRNNWTPIMRAAVTGQKLVFDYLVQNSADMSSQDDNGNTLLHLACRGGNREIVQHLLTPLNINCRGADGLTPVMLAASGGHLSVFNLLVENKADLTLVDDNMNSLLHLACQGGNKDIVQVLTPSNISCRGKSGLSPVMTAAVYGHLSVFNLLISNNADITLKTKEGDTVLHMATIGGNKDIVQQVLALTNINSRNETGWTPIMNAASEGHQKVFDFLVSNNADLTLVDNDGNDLLQIACSGGNKHIVQRSLTPSNINRVGKHGWTPAMKAAGNGNLYAFEFLLSSNADLTLIDARGNTTLHLACRGGDKDIVRRTLTPSNINLRGDNGWTPIMIAALAGHHEVFFFLVSKKADLKLISKSGNSLLHLACEGGSKDIVQHLLQSANLNKRGSNGWTPIMVAAVNGHRSVFELLASKKPNLTQVDAYGDGITQLACKGGNRHIVQCVLTPSTVNKRGENGWTPAMIAAGWSYRGVFDLLVSNKADFTMVDDFGDSVLHLACQGGNRGIVQQLLTTSDINKKGRDCLTPMMRAAYCGHKHIVDLLVESNADLTHAITCAEKGGHLDIVRHLKDILKKDCIVVDLTSLLLK